MREFELKALQKPNLHQRGAIKNPDKPLRSMLCGQTTAPKFTSVMKASLIYLDLMGNSMFIFRLWKPEVYAEVSKAGEVSWFGGVFSIAAVESLIKLL